MSNLRLRLVPLSWGEKDDFGDIFVDALADVLGMFQIRVFGEHLETALDSLISRRDCASAVILVDGVDWCHKIALGDRDNDVQRVLA